MSAEDEAVPEVQEGPSTEAPPLGIYKNPELIESVVVFDPIGGSSQKFQDVSHVYIAGMTTAVESVTDIDWSISGKSPKLLDDNGSPICFEVCRSADNPGGLAARDLRGSSTNPIQFRFDGIPMVLPRESYIEVTLNLLYLGPSCAIFRNELNTSLEGLKSHGWARTASGLIQLVQAVDVSATSFQSPDMTTQNFLEALQTKDAELVLRPDYFFNSFITGGFLLPKDLKSSVTEVTTFNRAPGTSFQDPVSSAYDPLPGSLEEYVTVYGGMKIPVTFRIPLAAISPVFKTDVLPLYMTNSTSINIQFQVQNPTIPFPLYSPMAGEPDSTTKLAKLAWKSSGSFATNYGAQLDAANSEILAFGSTRGTNQTSIHPLDYQCYWNGRLLRVNLLDGGLMLYGAPSTYAGGSMYAMPQVQSRFTPTVGPLAPGQELWKGRYYAFDSKIITSDGRLNYLFWDSAFSIKAYIKTYASVYQNPLAERYLRPYMVGGPDGQNSFFRTSFLSYNFNSSTVTVPANGSINFAFNISQTLLNVPMAFLMFSEISYEGTTSSTAYVAPVEMNITLPDTVSASNVKVFRLDDGARPGPVYTAAVTTPSAAPAIIANLNAVLPAINAAEDADYDNHTSIRYGLLDVLHRSQYFISSDLDVRGVQVQIGPSGWNLYQRPLDIPAMNAITLNTLTRYDSEMCWSERVKHPQRFHLGDAFACFDLSHDLFRGLFIDSDNMLNITGMLYNSSNSPKTIYLQCILPYIDHFVISLSDATVSKSQL